MKITWVSITPETEGCLLGSVCIGGIIRTGQAHPKGPVFYRVNCLLPYCGVQVKEFAQLDEIKASFEKAVAEWVEMAGLA